MNLVYSHSSAANRCKITRNIIVTIVFLKTSSTLNVVLCPSPRLSLAYILKGGDDLTSERFPILSLEICNDD
jgi:hypothetical protein